MKQPKIRLRGYNGAWMQTTWGTLTSDFKYGINAAAKLYDGKNKYLRITDIDDTTRVFLQDNLTTPDANLSSCEEYVMQNGDIVIARTGASVGKSYIYHKSDGRVYFAGFLIRMRLKDNVDKDFIFQNTLTESYAKHIRIVSQRSGQPGVNVDELKSYSLSMPTNKEEQQTLGSYFHHLDTLIQSTAKKIESLKQVKAASLQSMFPQEGETSPRVRFKGFEGEWEIVKLNSFAKRLTRKNLHLESTLALTIASAHGLVSQIDYFNNLVVGSNIRNYYLLKKGEFAYNKSYSNGYPFGSIKRLDRYEQGILSTLYITFSVNDNISSDYLTHFFATELWHKEVAERAAEGARSHGLLNIGAKEFFEMNIKKPISKEEQQKIANYFTYLDSQITLQTQRLEKLKQIKSACLDNMFV